jgi:hypothetical protein
MEDELVIFNESIKNKALTTIKTYNRMYNKLYYLTEKPIHETSQSLVLELIEEENVNTRQALLNISLLVRRLYKLDTSELELNREKNKQVIVEKIQEKNAVIELPSLEMLFLYLDTLWDTKKYTEFAINWLLLNLNTRNTDLNIIFIRRKKDAINPTQNYIWLQTTKKATLFRRNYKTVASYGHLTNIITDTRFIKAMKMVEKERSNLISNLGDIGNIVKKATFEALGEVIYMKIAISDTGNDLQKIIKISKNRGTSVITLANHYDIKNVMVLPE